MIEPSAKTAVEAVMRAENLLAEIERQEKAEIKRLLLREPGGTAIGEAIRHLLQHSEENHGMTAETELLLFEASRSQLVREKIQTGLARSEWVICDRFLIPARFIRARRAIST